MNLTEVIGDPVLRRDLDRVEVRLRISVASENPFMARVISHLAEAGGKRLRPALVVISAYAVAATEPRAVNERVISAAVAVELLHIGSLYHDDVIDEATSRRGTASANACWGNMIAVLGGDRLLATSSEICAALGQEESAVLASALAALCEGQMLESHLTHSAERSEADYLDSIAGKTAALVATACRFGGLEGGGDAETIDALTSFGQNLGMAFQVIDDILDLIADGDVLGKPTGNDLIEGVYTVPVIRACADQPELRGLLRREMTPEIVTEIRDLVIASGAVESAFDLATTFADEASAALDSVQLSATVKRTLRAIPNLVLKQVQDVAAFDTSSRSATLS